MKEENSSKYNPPIMVIGMLALFIMNGGGWLIDQVEERYAWHPSPLIGLIILGVLLLGSPVVAWLSWRVLCYIIRWSH